MEARVIFTKAWAFTCSAVHSNFTDNAVTHFSDPQASPPGSTSAGDLYDPYAAKRRAQNLYEEAIASLRALANQALATAPGDDTTQLAHDIAVLLHNLGGTAGHFGDAEFGAQLRSLEQLTRSAILAQWLQPQCREILAGIDRR